MKYDKKALQWSAELIGLEQSIKADDSKVFKAIANHIDNLINTDFNKLISILYRIDVSQEKLKKALSSRSQDKTQGEIIAKLIIQRQVQKLKFRKEFKNKSSKL